MPELPEMFAPIVARGVALGVSPGGCVGFPALRRVRVVTQGLVLAYRADRWAPRVVPAGLPERCTAAAANHRLHCSTCLPAPLRLACRRTALLRPAPLPGAVPALEQLAVKLYSPDASVHTMGGGAPPPTLTSLVRAGPCWGAGPCDALGRWAAPWLPGPVCALGCSAPSHVCLGCCCRRPPAGPGRLHH